MTGKPFKKTRVVKREARIDESGPDRFEKAAKEFLSQKQDYVHGLTVVDKLNTKSAIGGPSKKPTYENTDNKTRTNKGGVPGMVEEPGGIRYVPNEKNGPGKILRPFPTRRSTAQKNNKRPNVGWIEEPKSATYEEYVEHLKNQPQIRLRKYRVNPRNGEPIEGSEQVLDPFSLNGNPAPDQKIFEEKRLPGLTLGRRGRSLVSRAAAAFGVIADADGKFRCPPGTPAANQFTDSTGSNCFGISAEEITEMAREAAESLSSGRAEKIKNVPAKLFEFLSWLDNGGIPGLGRTVWTDPDGKRIKNIKKWNEARTSQYSRTFVNGMVRAQERLKQQDEVVNELLNALGVDQSDENRLNNQDLFDAFRLLDETGRWQLDISGRLNPDEVKGLVSQRLQSVPGFSKLPDSRKQSIIDSDVERWYETERAMLEAALDHFIMDPEAAKTIGAIEFERKTDSSVMDEASTSFVVGSESGKFKSVIKIDLPFIMTTQESVIPQLAPNERLKIDVVGARTDAQAANHLTDFLVTVNGHSKQLAAMVERRGLARHIMKHEIFHSVQGQAILQAAQDVIDANGYIDIKFRSGQIKRYQSISEMPSDAIVALMKRPSPQLDITRLNNAVQKMDQVGFLAGEYPKQYFLNPEDYEAEGLSIWLAEASAELAALRDLGIVYGDDIDAALEWQDAYSDGAYALDRVKQLSVKKALEESLPEGGTIPARDIFANSLAEVEKAKGMARKQRIKSLKARVEDTSTPEAEIVDMLAKYRAQLEENKQLYLRGERDGIPTDSPAMRKYAENVDELNEVSRAIEGSWLDRFGLNDKDSKARYRKQLEEKVRQRRFASGTLSEDDSKEYVREMHLDSLREQSLVMDMDDLQEQVVAKNVEMKQPGLSEEQKLEIAEEKNIFMSALKKKASESGDPREFNSRKREIERRVEAIINPPSEKEEHARRVQEAERIKRATKKQLVSDVKNWVSDPSTTEESVIGRAAISSARRKSLIDQYEKMEKAGISGDSQEMREIASEIEQATDELKTIERSWASRFGSPNPDKKKEQKKKFSENVKKKQIKNGLASDEEVKRSIRQEQISALQSRAESISETSLEDEIVSLEIASIDASVSSDRRKEINEEKNILTSILRRRIVSSDTPEKWSESRKNIRKKVSDIMSPPESRPLKKTKKFRTDRAAESYASEHFTKSSKNMTVSEVNALAELSDTNKTSIARILDPATQDSAISEISIRHSTLRSDGVQIDPTSREQGSVDDQIRNILVPALRAIDKSVIDEDLEMEAIVGLPTESSLKNTDISSVIEHDGLITGSLVTGQSPGSGSTLSNPDGSDVVVGDKKMQRIIIQVEKGKKGTFPTWAFDRDARGSRTEQKLTIPPGSLRIVEIREDGTIVARVSEQKTADQVLDKFSIGSNKSINANSPDAVKQGAARRAKKSARKAASSTKETGPLQPGRKESDRARRASGPKKRRVISEGEKLSSGLQEEDFAQVSGSRSISKNTISKTTAKVKSFDGLTEMDVESTEYLIGGERVVFDSPHVSYEDPSIKVVTRNPFVISGLDEKSDKGREISLKWAAAHAGNVGESSREETEVDALLYAAMRGDSNAMNEFEKLAEIGMKKIAEQRKKQLGSRKLSEEQMRDIKREGLENLGIDDLYIVHETSHSPQVDENGDIELRPLADFDTETKNGEKIRYPRHTVHFALNQLAGGHVLRQRSEKDTDIIIIPLRDIIEDNPDSLDALYSVDTYFTPKPGEGLKLKKGKYRLVKSTPDDKETRDAVNRELTDMGAKHVFEAPSAESGTPGTDAAVALIGSELGVDGGLHANNPSGIIERALEKARADGKNINLNDPYFVELLARMSDNAKMRFGLTDWWQSSKEKRAMVDRKPRR